AGARLSAGRRGRDRQRPQERNRRHPSDPSFPRPIPITEESDDKDFTEKRCLNHGFNGLHGLHGSTQYPIPNASTPQRLNTLPPILSILKILFILSKNQKHSNALTPCIRALAGRSV